MKFIHLSDLHLGKRLFEYSLIEDQKFILKQILEIIKKEQPQAVILAGDIYDKSIASVEAVQLFDEFLTQLASLDVAVFVISGNHDSAERLAFAGRLLRGNKIYVSTAYTGKLDCVELEDEHGKVNFYLLPFVKPVHVRHALGDELTEEVLSYHEAVAQVLAREDIPAAERNVLVAHQFVTGAQTCESEAVNVGGLDNIGAEVFAPFDYVALGHIHSPQNVGSERVRYSGTPLKYSFSEAQQEKSVSVVELGAQGEVSVRTEVLVPWRELRKVRGLYNDVMTASFYKDFPKDEDGRLLDFYHVTLLDEQDVVDALQKLRSVYKHVLQLEYQNRRTQSVSDVAPTQAVEKKTSLDLVSEFFALQNNQELSDVQKAYVQNLLEGLEEAR